MLELYTPDNYRDAVDGYHNRKTQEEFARAASKILDSICLSLNRTSLYLITRGASGIILSSAIKAIRPRHILIHTDLDKHKQYPSLSETCVFIDDYIESGATLEKAYNEVHFETVIVIDANENIRDSFADFHGTSLTIYCLRNLLQES